MSASKNKPWKKFISRDKVQGGGGGKVLRTFRGEAAYVGRLRRLETVVLVLTMKLKVPPKVLDGLLESMLHIVDVDGAKPGSGGEDAGDPLPLPHSGPANGTPERET